MKNQFSKILFFERKRLLKNPVFVLGSVFIGMIFCYLALILCKNAEFILPFIRQEENANDLSLPLLVNVLTDNYVKEIIDVNAPLQATFHYLVFFFSPGLIMLMASDQMASDVGSKHIRFILPRVLRKNYYRYRVLSVLLIVLTVLFTFTLSLNLVMSLISDSSYFVENSILSLKYSFFLVCYSAPFIMLMSFANSFISNSFLAFLLGLGIWALVALISALASIFNPNLAYISYLSPSVFRSQFFEAGSGPLWAVVGSLLYAVAFYFLGWRIFKKRDL